MRAVSKYPRSPLMIHSEISKFSNILLPDSFLVSLREAVLNSKQIYLFLFFFMESQNKIVSFGKHTVFQKH